MEGFGQTVGWGQGDVEADAGAHDDVRSCTIAERAEGDTTGWGAPFGVTSELQVYQGIVYWGYPADRPQGQPLPKGNGSTYSG